MQSTLFAIHQQPSPAQLTTTAATTFSYVLTATTATAEGTGTTTYSNHSQSQTTASGQGDSTPDVAPLTASTDGKSSLLIIVSVSGSFVCFLRIFAASCLQFQSLWLLLFFGCVFKNICCCLLFSVLFCLFVICLLTV